MGRLAEKLAGYPVIGLDTTVFIYHLEASLSFHQLPRKFFLGWSRGAGVQRNCGWSFAFARPVRFRWLPVWPG
jgi:hypothetical protein